MRQRHKVEIRRKRYQLCSAVGLYVSMSASILATSFNQTLAYHSLCVYMKTNGFKCFC